MIKGFHKKMRHILTCERGVVSVELVIMLPLLFWCYMATAVFFDAFRQKSTTEKAAYTISDMLSRETNAIDDTYLTNTRRLFDSLTESSSPSSMRVSVVTWDQEDDSYALNWSHVRGDGYVALTDADLLDLEEQLPAMADEDNVILFETTTTYEPSLDVGIGSRTIRTFVFTRSRYAPQLVWESAV